MSLSRRRFLTRGAASAAVISGTAQVPNLLLRAAAAESSLGDGRERVLVVLQLSGGNDGLNTVTPYADDQYSRNRFQTRIGPSAVHKIDDYLGLHPALEKLYRRLQDGAVSIVQGVGYPQPNRSHFESMDIWHTASVDGAGGGRRTGWLGRTVEAATGGGAANGAADVPAVHLGAEVQPLALAGLHVQVPSIGSLEDFQFDPNVNAELAAARQRLISLAGADGQASAGDLIDHVRAAAATALTSSRRVQGAVRQRGSSSDYPRTTLGEKLRGVGQLIRAGLATRIYYVTLDGFDTHSLQAEAHAALLRELSEAVSAFLDDLESAGQADRVLLMCFSEFGRRVKENASRGTDHGAAAPMLLVGQPVAGGLHGEHPSLTDLVDGDLKFHTDFRRVYATVLEQWLQVDSEPILGGSFETLPLLA